LARSQPHVLSIPIYSGLNKRIADEARPTLTSESILFDFAFGAHILFGDEKPLYATVMRDPLERGSLFIVITLESLILPILSL
jgi:hypothetical protein